MSEVVTSGDDRTFICCRACVEEVFRSTNDNIEIREYERLTVYQVHKGEVIVECSRHQRRVARIHTVGIYR